MWIIFLIFSLLLPRLAMIIIFLFTNWFSMAFQTIIWPLLGFIFLPYTTLAYMTAMIANDHQIAGGWLVIVVIAVIFDLGGLGMHRLR